MRHEFQFYLLKRISNVRWKVASEFIIPKGILLYLNILAWRVKFFLSLYSSAIGILQYSKFQSRVEMIFASPIESINSSIMCIWYVSLTATGFNFL